jgi:hypothetical protein
MFDGLLAPVHLLVAVVLVALFCGGILLLRRLTRPTRPDTPTNPQHQEQIAAERWKENANPFTGAP